MSVRQTLCHESSALQTSETDSHLSLVSQPCFSQGVFNPLHTKGLLANISMVPGVEACSPLSPVFLSHGFTVTSAKPVFLQACLGPMDCDLLSGWIEEMRGWERLFCRRELTVCVKSTS